MLFTMIVTVNRPMWNVIRIRFTSLPEVVAKTAPFVSNSVPKGLYQFSTEKTRAAPLTKGERRGIIMIEGRRLDKTVSPVKVRVYRLSNN